LGCWLIVEGVGVAVFAVDIGGGVLDELFDVSVEDFADIVVCGQGLLKPIWRGRCVASELVESGSELADLVSGDSDNEVPVAVFERCGDYSN